MEIRPSRSLPIAGIGGNVPSSMQGQVNLFPLRVSTIYPGLVNGADIEFVCEAEQGGTYYCKNDKNGRLIRATEWLFTHLANHLNIVTPECAVLENPHTGDTLFGSLQIASPASDIQLNAFLTNSQLGEVGQPSEWPGAYLSGLYTVDLFMNNPDRGFQNFILQKYGFGNRLCAFDFAASKISTLTGNEFPIASDPTVQIGRYLRDKHGFFRRASFEMIDRIAAVPRDTIASFLTRMPVDWMTTEHREVICELWSGKKFGGRLTALRTGIADGSFL